MMHRLYAIRWSTPLRRGLEYIVATGTYNAEDLFTRKHPRRRILDIYRVPNWWNVRWPIMWGRIGQQYKEDCKNRYIEWWPKWKTMWKEIGWATWMN